MLKYVPIMLCCTAPKIYQLCSTNAVIMLKLYVSRAYNLMLLSQTLESPHDQVSAKLLEILPILLTSCLMLLHTYYAHFDAGTMYIPRSYFVSKVSVKSCLHNFIRHNYIINEELPQTSIS